MSNSIQHHEFCLSKTKINAWKREISNKMDVKDESKRIFTLCQGCLSPDRKLKCITGQNKALFIKLREDVILNENVSVFVFFLT